MCHDRNTITPVIYNQTKKQHEQERLVNREIRRKPELEEKIFSDDRSRKNMKDEQIRKLRNGNHRPRRLF